MAHSSGMIISLDRSSDVPLGTQLAWQLRAAIAAGSLRPGDRLPGVRELAAEAGVNVNTVRAVYGRLAEQGAIVSEHGRGTFVRDGGAARGGVGELVERVAGEARRRRVDARELAALLYARAEAGGGGDEAAGGDASAADEIAERRALRTEIEALEHQLATLEAPRAAGAGARADDELPERLGAAVGARLVSARELAATRDALAERVSARRAELRGARAAARRRALEPPQRRRPEPDSAWPELLAGAAGLRARRA